MKKNHGLFAVCGVVLLAVGAALTWWSSRGFTEKQYVVDAGACRLELTMLEKSGVTSTDKNSVVLFHGLAANRKIMENLARVFAEMDVRVFIPDLPGHGGSAGPFTPQRAEECSLSLLRGLAARGMIDPEHTLLVGHSMGAAIALRLAPKFRPAGVIAISPAPMVARHGVSDENLLYRDPPPLVANTLILASQFEPKGLRANAQDLAATRQDGTVQFKLIPHNTHVGVLFSKTVAQECQAWTQRVFHGTAQARVPSEANVAAGLLGILGILLLAVPFLWEMFGKEAEKETDKDTSKKEEVPEGLPSPWRVGAEFAGISIAVMIFLKYWVPLRFIHLFEGDYLASFFLIAGLLLIGFHAKLAQAGARAKASVLFAAVAAGIILHLLITGWFSLTVTGAWLTSGRWLRFPLFFVSAAVFLYALEIVLGPAEEHHALRRVLLSLVYLGIAWAVLAAGVFHLHTGQIMLVLLAPFFVLFSIFLRMGMQLVRRLSASPAAAAVFGAILLAGLCSVLFPVS